MKYFEKIYKNWVFHNLVSHPLSELAYWVFGEKISNKIHDFSVPKHVPGKGRG